MTGRCVCVCVVHPIPTGTKAQQHKAQSKSMRKREGFARPACRQAGPLAPRVKGCPVAYRRPQLFRSEVGLQSVLLEFPAAPVVAMRRAQGGQGAQLVAALLILATENEPEPSP